MNHAVFAGSDVDECAELKDTYDGTFKHVADLGIFRDCKDDCLCAFCAVDVFASDKYHSVVADVDFDAGFVDDLVDDFSARSDDVFDLVGIDVEADNLGRVFRKFFPGFRNAFRHLVKDEEPALTSLFQSGAKDFFVDALNLDIHLDCGDTVFRAGNLEVHVAKEVFKSLNIAHDSDSAGFVVLDKSHCDTCDGSLNRYTCVFKSHRAAAYARHRSRAVAAQNVRYRTDCIREFEFVGKDGFKRAFCKCAVSDFATSGRFCGFRFAGRIRGHVVVMHISLVIVVVKTFELLHFGNRAERASRQSLGLSAGEYRAAVNSRQNAVFAPDRTNFGERTTVGTNTFVKDFRADFDFLQSVKRVADRT